MRALIPLLPSEGLTPALVLAIASQPLLARGKNERKTAPNSEYNSKRDMESSERTNESRRGGTNWNEGMLGRGLQGNKPMGNVKPERVTKPQKQNRGVEERIRGRTAWHSRYRLLASDALDSF